jgi:ribosomal protein S27AE
VTGFPPKVREQITRRANGTCERCGLPGVVFQHHHRRARGAGGSKAADTNVASNGLNLHPDCHTWIESHREDALHYGWLVRQGHKPAEMPVWIGWRWVLLNNDETTKEVAHGGK